MTGGDGARTAAAVAARRLSTKAALARVRDVLARMRREKTPVTVAAVSRRAAVSRTFHRTGTAQDLADRDAGQEAAWRERALNAEDALKAAHAEIIQQRERIGELLGQVRDMEAEWTQDAIQRITTENTTLKQRVRQLTADNRILDERLKAARSNLRFQDRRVADLEARLLDPAQETGQTSIQCPGRHPGGRACDICRRSPESARRRPSTAVLMRAGSLTGT